MFVCVGTDVRISMYTSERLFEFEFLDIFKGNVPFLTLEICHIAIREF